MEEWRSGKDSRGRVAEAQWKLIMQGTKVCHHFSINQSLNIFNVLGGNWDPTDKLSARCYPDLLPHGLWVKCWPVHFQLGFQTIHTKLFHLFFISSLFCFFNFFNCIFYLYILFVFQKSLDLKEDKINCLQSQISVERVASRYQHPPSSQHHHCSFFGALLSNALNIQCLVCIDFPVIVC